MKLAMIVHHHQWLDTPVWTPAFFRSFRQSWAAVASSLFVTFFPRVEFSAPRPGNDPLGYIQEEEIPG
jgi:hypothetical protein